MSEVQQFVFRRVLSINDSRCFPGRGLRHEAQWLALRFYGISQFMGAAGSPGAQQLNLYFSTWLSLQGAHQEREKCKQGCEPCASHEAGRAGRGFPVD